MENGNQPTHLDHDTMQRAIGMLIAQESQVEVAEALGTSQSVISRFWKRYHMTGIPEEQNPGPLHLTTPVRDRYLFQ